MQAAGPAETIRPEKIYMHQHENVSVWFGYCLTHFGNPQVSQIHHSGLTGP